MSLFRDLVTNRFLANAPGELQRAKSAFDQSEVVNFHSFVLDEKKHIYYVYFDDAEFYKDLAEISLDGPDLIYIVNKGALMFCFSVSKKQIDNTIKFCYNLNGDIPIHRTRHLVDNKYVYTALFDTRFTVPPQSPN